MIKTIKHEEYEYHDNDAARKNGKTGDIGSCCL